MIDNLNGYEIMCEGKDKNSKTELAYQVMLFNDQGDYFLFFGLANENHEKHLEDYKKIAKSFKRK